MRVVFNGSDYCVEARADTGTGSGSASAVSAFGGRTARSFLPSGRVSKVDMGDSESYYRSIVMSVSESRHWSTIGDHR